MKRRMLIGLVVALLLSMSLVGLASAHAELDSSDPAAGANLTAAPTKVTLVFSEEISANETESFFTVKDEQGATVGTGKLDNADVNHETMSATLNSGLADGVYTVSWQATTPDDAGKTEGSFAFGVNKDPSAQPAAAQPTAAPAAEQPTAAPAAEQPTTAPAADAAQPTAAPTAAPAANAPSTLPRTAGDQPDLSGYALLGALMLLVGTLVLLRSKRRA